MSLTIVIPVYNEAQSLPPLVEGIERHAADVPHRILLVDDGSTDGSWACMLKLRESRQNLDVVRLRRNFGKTVALRVGFDRARGDRVITMDGDLQDDPAEIPRMLAKLEEGYDLVSGWKQKRHDPWHKTIPSRVYNGWVCRLFGMGLHDVNSGFKAMRMEVARAVPLFGDMHRLIPVFAHALGYRVTEIPVTHHARRFGQSKYGLERFAKGAFDLVAARLMIFYSDSPVRYYARVAAAFVLAVGTAAIVGGVVLATLGAPWTAWAVYAALCAVVSGLGAGVVTLLGMGLFGEWVLHRAPKQDTRIFIAEAHTD